MLDLISYTVLYKVVIFCEDITTEKTLSIFLLNVDVSCAC